MCVCSRGREREREREPTGLGSAEEDGQYCSIVGVGGITVEDVGPGEWRRAIASSPTGSRR